MGTLVLPGAAILVKGNCSGFFITGDWKNYHRPVISQALVC
jgi:hypothetical protein